MSNQSYIVGDVPKHLVQLQRDVEDILKHPIFRGALKAVLLPNNDLIVVARGDESAVRPLFSICLWLSTTEEPGDLQRCVTLQHGHKLHLAWFFDDAIAKLLALKYKARLFDDGCGEIEVAMPVDSDPYKGRELTRFIDGMDLNSHRVLRQFMDESRGLVI